MTSTFLVKLTVSPSDSLDGLASAIAESLDEFDLVSVIPWDHPSLQPQTNMLAPETGVESPERLF